MIGYRIPDSACTSGFRLDPGKSLEVVCEHRTSDIMVESLPSLSVGAVKLEGALERGDVSFDTCSEVCVLFCTPKCSWPCRLLTSHASWKKTTSLTLNSLAVARLSFDVKPPSALNLRGIELNKVLCRSSMGMYCSDLAHHRQTPCSASIFPDRSDQ